MRFLIALFLACQNTQKENPCTCPSASAGASAAATTALNNDPPARLENSCGELRKAAKNSLGRTFPKYEHVYGTAVTYTKEMSYGTVGPGSEIELLDKQPLLPEGKFPTLMIKVRVVCVPDDTYAVQGRIGWVELAHTSFSDAYDPRTKKVEQ